MKTHNLKCYPEYFREAQRGNKKFEIRVNDRDFKKGDRINLEEFDPVKNQYTGASEIYQINYILNGGQFGIDEKMIIMSIDWP